MSKTRQACHSWISENSDVNLIDIILEVMLSLPTHTQRIKKSLSPDTKVTHDYHDIVADGWVGGNLQLASQSSNTLLSQTLVLQT